MMWSSAALVVVLALATACSAARPGGPIVGAPTGVNVNTPEVREALKYAVEEFNTMVNGEYIFKVGRVIKAQTQIVEGIMYLFEVEMAGTNCRKGTEVTPTCDNAEPASRPYTCNFEVWSRPWLGQPIVYKAFCKQ